MFTHLEDAVALLCPESEEMRQSKARPISEMADLGTKTAMQRHIMSSYRRTGALISLQGSFLLRISALYRPYSRIRSSTAPNGRRRPWAESGPNEAIGRNC